MPVAQQPSHLFSFLHSRHHPSQNNNAPNSHGGLSQGAAPDWGPPYQAFESRLTDRLSSLLPSDDPRCFSLSSFNDYMGLLLGTQADLRSLIPSSQTHRRSMDEFLDRSITVLDVCRDIREQVAEVESLQGLLEIVAPCLISKQGRRAPDEGQIRRARKILGQLLALMRVETGNGGMRANVETRPSFRGRLRERLSGHHNPEGSPQRWRSWHGHQEATASSSAPATNSVPIPHSHSSLSASSSSGHSQAAAGRLYPPPHAVGIPNNAHAAEVIRALHSLELGLVPPKLTVRDEEESFTSAIYALNVMSVFFLGTITAAFPSLGVTAHEIGSIHPPNSFGWSAAFLHIQEKVQEDLSARSRRRAVHAGVLELDALCCIIKRLLELTTSEGLSWSVDVQEEVQRLVSQFDEHLHELRTELMNFNKQIADFYNRIISARSEVFYILCNVGVE